MKNDSEECILPKEDYEELLHKKGLGRFFTTVKLPKNEDFEEKKEAPINSF